MELNKTDDYIQTNLKRIRFILGFFFFHIIFECVTESKGFLMPVIPAEHACDLYLAGFDLSLVPIIGLPGPLLTAL